MITVNTEAFLHNASALNIGGQQQQHLQQISPDLNQRQQQQQLSSLRNNNNSNEESHANQVGVVRLAGPSTAVIKMEYPHHSDADNGGPTVVMTSPNGHHHHHESVVMHTQQHVEVIKTAGHVPPLHTSSANEHHQHLSPKDTDGQNSTMLQVRRFCSCTVETKVCSNLYCMIL